MSTKTGHIAIAFWLIILLSGCVSDPLTQTLKKYGYAPIMPLPATMHIGDIYETKGLRDPYVFMRDKLFDYIQQNMEKITSVQNKN